MGGEEFFFINLVVAFRRKKLPIKEGDRPKFFIGI
jgi:hypothetical protein